MHLSVHRSGVLARAPAPLATPARLSPPVFARGGDGAPRPPPSRTRPPRAAANAGSSSDPPASPPASSGPRPLEPPHPGYQEERDVSHAAFMRAFRGSHPVAAAVPGLQEFAASLLDRRRNIPSAASADPLDHVFAEADLDGDGRLTAAEVSAALRSRGVEASAEIVGRYIRCARLDGGAAGGAPTPPAGDLSGEVVARAEFPAFVLAMASADMHHHGPSPSPPPSSSGGGGGGARP